MTTPGGGAGWDPAGPPAFRAWAELPGIGRAARCVVSPSHWPRPRRFVWHHVLPQACGGRTEPGNLEQVCDSCHYAIHDLLWRLAHEPGLTARAARASRAQWAIASRGWQAAVAAGTAGRIPKEA